MRIKRDDAPSERAGGNFFFCCAVKIYMGKFCKLSVKNIDKKFFVL